MTFLLSYSALLVVAALLSAIARRTVLSTAVVFLLGGVILGPELLDVVSVDPTGPLVHWVTEIALFVVLFTDAMRIPARELVRSWRVPARLLLVAMPLTIVVIAASAHLLLGLGLAASVLLAGILAPTDPVLSSALIGHEGVPWKLRRSLNVESGLNDGLALPVVLLALAAVSAEATSWLSILGHMALGVAIGVGVPLLVALLEKLPKLETTDRYDPVMVAGVGLVVFSLAGATSANLFLAAFSAGITLASVAGPRAERFDAVGGTATELLKLAALFLVGALLPPSFYSGWTLASVAFVVLVLLVARPAAVLLSLLGSPAPWVDRAVMGWFGPKGFASVTFTLLVIRSGSPAAGTVAFAAAGVIVCSVVLHASTDVPIGNWLAARADAGPAATSPHGTGPTGEGRRA